MGSVECCSDPGDPISILIVEDNEVHMILVNDILEVHGYKTLKARHGLEAIKLAQASRPDLILMDIQLPDISGIEVTHLLKQNNRTKWIPIIGVTAFAMPKDRQKVLESGCDACITKPITIHDFLRTVESFLPGFPPDLNRSVIHSPNVDPRATGMRHHQPGYHAPGDRDCRRDRQVCFEVAKREGLPADDGCRERERCCSRPKW